MPAGKHPRGEELEQRRVAYHSLRRKRNYREEDTPDSSDGDVSGYSSDRDGSQSTVQSGNHHAGAAVLVEIAIAMVLLLCIGAGAYLWSQRDPATSSTAAAETATSAAGSKTASTTPVTASRASLATSPRESPYGSSATLQGGETSTSPSKTIAGTGSKSASLSSEIASPTGPAVTTNQGAPTAFKGITLTGKFAPSDSYTIATGDLANVPGPSSTIALDGLTTAANPAKETQGVIYVGDSTWYAAGNGGYGSCGEKLYDGQSIYFAAMSLYHWMGSPGPSPHCWSCVALQSVADPSKAITAIVADSCEACQFAHIDLEQRAYFALGGTVNSGVVTVAWEFVDCPDKYSKEAVSKLDGKEFKDVELS